MGADSEGRSFFYWACFEGKLEIAEYFIDMNCDINKCDNQSNSPLHPACDKGFLPIVHLLLSNGCKVNVQNSSKQTPLHIAAEKGHTKIVELLLDYHINSRFFKHVSLDEEIDMNIIDSKGQTALIKSILNNNIEVTKLLIENDADVNKADIEQRTALHYALFEGKDDIAIFLVLYGADINAKSKTGDTPIEFANAKLRKALVDIYNEISGRNDEDEAGGKQGS